MAQTTTTSTQTTSKFVEGQIVHTEFVCQDPKAFSNFMSKNFGWTFTSNKVPGMTGEYHTFSTPGNTAGGAVSPQNPGHSGTNTYIVVNDIKTTTKKLEKSGATILMQPSEIPGMGWLCLWQVKGAPIVGCWQPSSSSTTSR